MKMNVGGASDVCCRPAPPVKCAVGPDPPTPAQSAFLTADKCWTLKVGTWHMFVSVEGRD